MNIVLASGSPRRRELLEMLGVSFTVQPASGEDLVKDLGPAETVERIALGKALEVSATRNPDDLIIAADTLVYLDGRALGKPVDEEDAFKMLKSLSGREHQVYTGVSIVCNGENLSGYDVTSVRFRDMTDSEIRRYIATCEPMDKAGAYGAQGKGSVFITGITGDFFNVMGLPLWKLSEMLQNFGVTLV